MRKVMYNSYGDESMLELTEQPVPVPADNQLLIRVKAVSINPLDWKLYRGEMKMQSGSKFPKSVGIDFSGIVEKTGALVTGFKPGDAVIGLVDVFKGGALADYVVVSEKDIASKPGNIPFEAAAALPVTGLAALQILDKLAAVRAGQEVLINGATGGIGPFAIQIAKRRGARVTAVAGTDGTALAKKWGADNATDYTKQDVRSMPRRFDVVIDLSGKFPFPAAKALMKKQGIYVSSIPSVGAILHSVFNNIFSSRKEKILLLKPTKEGLDALSELAKDNLDILIDKTYTLSQVREAYRESMKGKIKGKSVIVL